MFYVELFENRTTRSLGKYGVLCYMNGTLDEWRIVVTTPSVDQIISGQPLTAVTYLLHSQIGYVGSVSIKIVESARFFNGFDLNNYQKTLNINLLSIAFSWSLKASIVYDREAMSYDQVLSTAPSNFGFGS
jgi:hypothetical protein